MAETLAALDADGDRRRRSRRVGPALLRQGGDAEPDRRPAADVAKAVVGAEAAVVIRAGDEHRPPAVGRLLQILDRDQLAAARDRRSLAPHPAAEANRLPVAQRKRRRAQLQRLAARRLEAAVAGEDDIDPS